MKLVERYRALRRPERVLVILVALSLLVATVRPLAALVSDDFAAYLTCPLAGDDLAWDERSGPVQRGVIHDDLVDGRGRPWRFVRHGEVPGSPRHVQLYSVGPDGEDDDGQGDDVVVAQRSRAGFPLLARTPWVGVGLAIVLLWGWAAVRAYQVPRGPVLLEAWRAAVLASPFAAVGAAAVLWWQRDLLRALRDLDARQLVVSGPTAAAGTLGLLLWLAALALRMRRPRGDDPEAPLAWRRPALLALAAVVVVCLMAVWAREDRAAFERRRILAQACLGLASVSEVAATNDDDLMRAFVRRNSPFAQVEGQPSLILDCLGRAAGAEANPLMARALGRDPSWSLDRNVPTVPWQHLRAHDPTLDALVAAAAARPASYRGLMLTKASLFAARLGRRAAARALEPLLHDAGPAGMRTSSRELRVCDLTLEVIQRLRLQPPTDWDVQDDAAVAEARAWVAAGAEVAPAGWIVIDVRDASPGARRSTVDVQGVGMNHRSVSDRPEHLVVGGPYEAPLVSSLAVTDSPAKRAVTVKVTVSPGETAWVLVDMVRGTYDVRALPVPP